jgi:hypothetical protein
MTPQARLSPAERFFLPLGMLLLVLAQYVNAINHPFLLGDHTAIVTQPQVTSPGGWRDLWGHAADATQPGIVAQYQPLTVLSYYLNTRLAGGVPQAQLFRLVNILLLGLVGIGTARWLRWRMPAPLAWSAAFLVVAHPTNIQTINCISGRAELLAVLGVLIFAIRQRGAMHRGRWSIAGGMTAFAAALLALGSAMTGLLLVPVALAQRWSGRQPEPPPPPRPRLDAAKHARGPGEPVSEPKCQSPLPPSPQQSRAVWLGAAMLLGAALLLYIVGRTAALGWGGHLWPDPAAPNWGDLAPNPMLGLAWRTRLPAAVALAGLYLRQLFWPDLSSNLVPSDLPGWNSGSMWLGIVVIVVGLAALAWAIRRRHWLLVPLALAWGHYLLVCQCLFPLPQYASNRLMLPFTLAAAVALAELLDRLLGRSMRVQAAVVIAASAVALALSTCVVLTNELWASDAQRITADAEAQPDNPTAMYRYAAHLSVIGGNIDKARDRLNDVLSCRPRSVQARMALADLERRAGNRERAATLYREALSIEPGYWRALSGLAELRHPATRP